MSTLTHLFEELSQEHNLLLKSLKSLPDALFNQKGVIGEWSIKNVLAHLTDWEKIVADFLPERLATGNKPTILLTINADEDAWNAHQISSHEHLTPQEQLTAFEHTRQALFQVLRDLGEDVLNRQQPWPEWQGTLAEYVLQSIGDHEHEHCGPVFAAIERLNP